MHVSCRYGITFCWYVFSVQNKIVQLLLKIGNGSRRSTSGAQFLYRSLDCVSVTPALSHRRIPFTSCSDTVRQMFRVPQLQGHRVPSGRFSPAFTDCRPHSSWVRMSTRTRTHYPHSPSWARTIGRFCATSDKCELMSCRWLAQMHAQIKLPTTAAAVLCCSWREAVCRTVQVCRPAHWTVNTGST